MPSLMQDNDSKHTRMWANIPNNMIDWPSRMAWFKPYLKFVRMEEVSAKMELSKNNSWYENTSRWDLDLIAWSS